MSFWNAALDGAVIGLAKSHSIEQSRMMTFGRGFITRGAGLVYW